jgi:hypothetical protein
MSEHPLQSALLDGLNKLPGIRAYRNNSGWKGHVAFGLRTTRNENGSPDLVLCVEGLFVGCELKDRGKKPTAEQYAWGEALERAGGIWIWGDDLKTIVERVLAIQKTRRAA